MFNGKTMENHHVLWENYGKSPCVIGKLWKITMFNGKTMGKSPGVMGKLWKITMCNGKTMENHHV